MFRSIKICIEKLHQAILKSDLQLDDFQLFKAISLYFINLPNVGRNEAFKAFMQVFYRGSNEDDVIPALQIMINGQSLAGQILRAWKADEDIISADAIMISAQETLSKPFKKGDIVALAEALFRSGLQ